MSKMFFLISKNCVYNARSGMPVARGLITGMFRGKDANIAAACEQCGTSMSC